MKRVFVVVVVVLLLGVATLIGGASAKSLIDEGAQESSTTEAPAQSGGTGADDSDLEPISPDSAETPIESESDKAAHQLDMIVIALVVLALVVAAVTVVIWRRSRPERAGRVQDPTGAREA